MRQVTPFDHRKVIADVATETLVPRGLVRLGRSMTWVDDHVWWVGKFHFATTSFGQPIAGLTVALSLLWHPTGEYLGPDVDHKSTWELPSGNFETQHVEARRPDWLERDVRIMTEAGLAHLDRIRGIRRDLSSVAAAFSGPLETDSYWNRYHRGIAAGLLRDAAACVAALSTIVREPNPYNDEDVRDTAATANALMQLATEDPAALDSAIVAAIAWSRTRARLPSLDKANILAALNAAR